MKRDLDFIVAMTRRRVMGRENQLPWRLPQDLKRFKEITTGHTIIMGRKTYDSIGRPLPNRLNLVLTRDKEFKAEGIKVCHSWHEIDESIQGQAFVIGGAEIFQQALPRLRKLYLTEIFEDFAGDVYFPEIPLAQDFVLEDKSQVFQEPFAFQFQNWKHRSFTST